MAIDDKATANVTMSYQTKQGHPRFYELLDELANLHSRKNSDYAGQGRPLGNFERRAQLLQMYPDFKPDMPYKVAMQDILKQLDAAFWMASHDTESQTGEDVGARLRDVAVYAMLASVMYEERTR